jgi:ketosteroid isomerase-like protein
MSQGNIEIVRASYDAYRRGDYLEALKCFAPDVIYEIDQEPPARGPGEVFQVWQRWADAWDEIDTVAEDFIETGNAVIISVEYSARGRASGIEFTDRLFDVYLMRDGKCVRKREFKTREEALKAAGVQ